jgi:hypothetical protein
MIVFGNFPESTSFDRKQIYFIISLGAPVSYLKDQFIILINIKQGGK